MEFINPTRYECDFFLSIPRADTRKPQRTHMRLYRPMPILDAILDPCCDVAERDTRPIKQQQRTNTKDPYQIFFCDFLFPSEPYDYTIRFFSGNQTIFLFLSLSLKHSRTHAHSCFDINTIFTHTPHLFINLYTYLYIHFFLNLSSSAVWYRVGRLAYAYNGRFLREIRPTWVDFPRRYLG